MSLTLSEFKIFIQKAIPRFASYWLNVDQEKSVIAPPNPPVFIVAGPGSGKTTVLALRVLKLILVDGFLPTQIIATTFTRKASAELRSRILSWGFATIEAIKADAKLSNNIGRLTWLDTIDINGVITGTLDSIAEDMLAEDRQAGEITPTIIESFLAKGLLRQKVVFSNGYHKNAGLEQHLISFNPSLDGSMLSKINTFHAFADRILHDGIDLSQYKLSGTGHNALGDLVTKYHDYLKNSNQMDFAQLENEILTRLVSGRLNNTTSKLKALLVDEFQDTNYLQERIYYELCKNSGASFTIVGDDDQSVYRFRGSTVEIFSDFENRIQTALGTAWKPVRFDLTENYRSTERIVELCNYYITQDHDFTSARVPGKLSCRASSSHANNPNVNLPVLGMFRHDLVTLVTSLSSFLIDIFQGNGVNYNTGNGGSITIQKGQGGDFGDAVLLGHSVGEITNQGRERLPLLLRRNLETKNIQVFNPRGRSLREIPQVSQCLGVLLECIDPGSKVQNSITSFTRKALTYLNQWRTDGRQLSQSNPQPGGLQKFITDWAQRNTVTMNKWPNEWPLLELLFTIITWIPFLRISPEGQVYLEVIARTIAESAQISPYSSMIINGTSYEHNSIKDILRGVFEPIAEGSVDVNEEIMQYVPRNFLPLMTIHQAKGLEFPLAIVDVGSDFTRNHHKQRILRFPDNGDNVHFTEDHVAAFTPVGVSRLQRNARRRAFDDLKRLYYVAKSRPENILLLIGLTTQTRPNNRIPGIATGDTMNGGRLYNFISINQWTSNMSANTIALI